MFFEKDLQFLKDNYNYFENGINKIITPNLNIIPADVYAEVRNGNYVIFWVIENKNNIIGFIVANIFVAEISKEKILSLPFIYFDSKKSLMFKADKFMTNLAKKLNCNKIEGYSLRKGFKKVLIEEGYIADCAIYVKKI